MQVASLSLELRPRSMLEASDLGVALVQAHARMVWACFLPVWLLVVAVAVAAVFWEPWAGSLLVFWLKPWMDRTLLFVLSRAVFGQRTDWRDVLRNASAVLWGGPWVFVRTIVFRRFSPWRAFTQPIVQLEGQSGSAKQKRRAVLLSGKRGAALMLQASFAHVEFALIAGVLSLVMWFAPSHLSIEEWFALGSSTSIATTLVTLLVYSMVVLFLEPFYVAGGLAMYLNRRVELESWDVEQEFRRAF
jgi:hypothetical protein